MQQISVADLKSRLDDAQKTPPVVLDVREAWERELCALPGSVHIPMGQIMARVGELDRAADLVVMCHHGGRSMQVAMFLERQGFAAVSNLAGGIDAWARQVDVSMATY
jgi:rhodanese-related sulfurtransferase